MFGTGFGTIKSAFTWLRAKPIAMMNQSTAMQDPNEKKCQPEIDKQCLVDESYFPDFIALLEEDLEDFARLARLAREAGAENTEFVQVSVKSLAKDHTKFIQFVEAIGPTEKARLVQRYRDSLAGVFCEPPLGFDLDPPKKLEFRSFTLHKTEYTRETNEDAFFVPSDIQLTPLKSAATFAVSDGATSSPDSRSWAYILVGESQTFGSERKKFLEGLPALKLKWKAKWEEYKSHQLTTTSDWFVEQSLERPNAATFCSITFEADSTHGGCGLKWKALAIGDSCLFHFRAGELVLSFPLDDVAGFTDHPTLVRSCGDANNFGADDNNITEKDGTALRGDTFVLATDAIAEWILAHVDNNNDYQRKILQLSRDSDFEKLVLDERAAGRLKDDDSTLVVIGVR
jgi:hypothetical protein